MNKQHWHASGWETTDGVAAHPPPFERLDRGIQGQNGQEFSKNGDNCARRACRKLSRRRQGATAGNRIAQRHQAHDPHEKDADIGGQGDTRAHATGTHDQNRCRGQHANDRGPQKTQPNGDGAPKHQRYIAADRRRSEPTLDNRLQILVETLRCNTKRSRRGTAARKVKQGGVKQSGQEPLDVQKWTLTMMDPIS